MKQIFYTLFLSLYFSVIVIAQVDQAVTNRLCPGRFGDKIIFYTLAKWISHKFNIPLFFKSFEYSSLLRLGKEEKKYSSGVLKKFKEGLLKIRSEQDVTVHAKDNVIFESDKYFFINGSHRKENLLAYISQDQKFMQKLKYMLQPIVSLPQIKFPKNTITVAVHVRKGGGVDQPLYSIQHYQNKKEQYADKQWPRKFPPEQYYVDQIKKISNLFSNQPLFVYVFTDDVNPVKLVDRLKKAVNKSNIIFLCRQSGNAHNVHLIEDFYNMSRFDCLVRADSCFSMVAQLLGNQKIIIFPKHFKWEDKKLIIDEVTIVDNRVS